MVSGKMGMGIGFYHGNGNGFMGMGGNGNRNSPSRTPLACMDAGDELSTAVRRRRQLLSRHLPQLRFINSSIFARRRRSASSHKMM